MIKKILMNKTKKYEKQHDFWEQAGKDGYGKAMFGNNEVEAHIMTRHWNFAVETAYKLGLNKDSKVIELGCGDGTFAGKILSQNFKQVTAYDKSSAAIEYAKKTFTEDNVFFYAEDLAKYDFSGSANCDAVFMMGFLHHVKSFTPEIISRLKNITDKIVVVEPNGNNLIRKTLELFPSYKRAGEDSFRLKQLLAIFKENGYEVKSVKYATLVPPFTPELLLSLFKKIEKLVERNRLLKRLCSSYILGFEKKS